MLWICVPGQGLQKICGPAAVFKQMGPLGRVGAASQTPCRGCIPYSFLDRQDLPLRGPAPLTVWPCSPAASPNVCFARRTRPPCARLQKYGCEVVAAGGPALLRVALHVTPGLPKKPSKLRGEHRRLRLARSTTRSSPTPAAAGPLKVVRRIAGSDDPAERRPRPTLCEAHRRKSPNSWRARAEAACGLHRMPPSPTRTPATWRTGSDFRGAPQREALSRAIPGLKFREMPNADSLLRPARYL